MFIGMLDHRINIPDKYERLLTITRIGNCTMYEERTQRIQEYLGSLK